MFPNCVKVLFAYVASLVNFLLLITNLWNILWHLNFTLFFIRQTVPYRKLAYFFHFLKQIVKWNLLPTECNRRLHSIPNPLSRQYANNTLSKLGAFSLRALIRSARATGYCRILDARYFHLFMISRYCASPIWWLHYYYFLWTHVFFMVELGYDMVKNYTR